MIQTNREKVAQCLREKSERLGQTKQSGVTASEIADALRIQRSTVSLYLNEMVKNDEALKINTRPVYFIDHNSYKQNPSAYPAFSASEEAERAPEDPFQQLIGVDGSLKAIVEQVKSAVIYPPNGLPCLLVGDSGVGKSLIAYLAYLYARKTGLCEGQWVVLNCAEYANNPELLSSMLFGHVKGAFTGAEKDKEGLLEAASGGYLFLDEVHRLSPENQEKLFQYMDRGAFRRVGETAPDRHSDARLIFATTERENADFLQTFLRRIPLVIDIPNFQERSKREKNALIAALFLHEAKTLSKNLVITTEVVQLLLTNINKGNIGKLSNIIKISCAKAFLKRVTRDRTLTLKLNDLPEDFLRQCDVSSRASTGDLSIHIDYEKATYQSRNTSESDKLYNFAQRLIDALLALEQQPEQTAKHLNQLANQLIDYVSFDLQDNQQTVFNDYIETILKSVLSNMYLHFGLNQFNSGSHILTKLVTYLNNYEDDRPVDQLIEANLIVKDAYNRQYRLCQMLIDALKRQFYIKNEMLYSLFIFDFLFSQANQLVSRPINAVIITHGFSTASSIATTVNRMLGTYVYESFDMPLEATVGDILRKLNTYFKGIDTSKELILLVDMGSLTTIETQLREMYSGNIGIITNVSTQIALVAGNRIVSNESFEKIVRESAHDVVPNYLFIQQQKKTDVILTTCITGIGATNYLQKLIKKNVANEIPVITRDYYQLVKNGKADPVFQRYHVKLIIGMEEDMQLEDIPYLSTEGLINREIGDSILKQAFPSAFTDATLAKMNQNLVRAFTIDSITSNLSILNPEQTVDQVEACVRRIERNLGTKLDVYLKVSLYMHLCFMMERLIRKEPNLDYPQLPQLQQCYQHFVRIVKDAFSEIQHYYSVDLPDSEIGFIYDILKNRVTIPSD